MTDLITKPHDQTHDQPHNWPHDRTLKMWCQESSGQFNTLAMFCYLFTISGFYMNSLLTPVYTTYMSMSFSTSPKSPWLWTLDLPGANNAMETWAERRSKCYWGWTGALLVMPMQCHLDCRGGGVSLWIFLRLSECNLCHQCFRAQNRAGHFKEWWWRRPGTKSPNAHLDCNRSEI